MLNCAHCEYKTPRRYNLNRHILTQHYDIEFDEDKEYNIGEKVNVIGEKVNVGGEKVNVGGEKVNVASEKLKCCHCYKVFTTERWLERHNEKCKKISSPTECRYCHRELSCKQSKCNHEKICKSTALIVVPPPLPPSLYADSSVGLDTVNTIIQNNIQEQQVIQTQNNVQEQTVINEQNNQQNITINVFPSNLKSDYNINTDHMDIKRLKKSIKDQSIAEAVGTSLRMVLENKENLPVKKKNIKSEYSYIHLGDDKWEMRQDKEVFGLISFHISRCIQVYIDGNNLKQLQQYYQEATEALEFVSADSEEDIGREMIKKAKRVMDVIKIGAYDHRVEK